MSRDAKLAAPSLLAAWEEGFSIVAAAINGVLPSGVRRIKAAPPAKGATLVVARRRFLNALLGFRPVLLDLPGDAELELWSVGKINGSTNEPTLLVPGDESSSLNASVRFLREHRHNWSRDDWKQFVRSVEDHAKKVRNWMAQVEQTQATGSGKGGQGANAIAPDPAKDRALRTIGEIYIVYGIKSDRERERLKKAVYRAKNRNVLPRGAFSEDDRPGARGEKLRFRPYAVCAEIDKSMQNERQHAGSAR